MASRRSRWGGLFALLVLWMGGPPSRLAEATDLSPATGGEVASSWPVHPVERAAANGGGFFRFIGVSGAGTSTDSGLDFSYSGAGCMSATGNLVLNGEWDADLHFAQDEEITFVRFYFFDSDPVDDIELFLFKFDGAGGLTTLANVSSSGSAGFGSVGLALSHFVNNGTGGLVLRFTQDDATVTSLRACAVRLVVQPS